MNITFLNHLDVSKDIYTIKVRIIKLWRQPSFKVPGESYAIEMILMDEEISLSGMYFARCFGRDAKEEKACGLCDLSHDHLEDFDSLRRFFLF
ncbi:hypothetical protein Hdeb2414_s0011g00364281 [Helianthus debilis subsp. tardiflorus]